MTINDNNGNEKLQYDANREASNISAILSGKTDKYEYLIGDKILPFDQRRVIEHAKFTYSPLRKPIYSSLTNKDDHKENYKEIFEN